LYIRAAPQPVAPPLYLQAWPVKRQEQPVPLQSPQHDQSPNTGTIAAAATFTIHEKTAKTAIVSADVFGIEDSEDTWSVKKVTFGSLLTWLSGTFVESTNGAMILGSSTDLTHLTTVDVTAGSFVSGVKYQIKTVGTTDFTAIGASANTIGVYFIAAGVGSGTGTATRCANIIAETPTDKGLQAYNATATDTLLARAEYGYSIVPVAWMKNGTSGPDALNDATGRSPYAYRTFDSAADEDLNFVWFVPSDLGTTTTLQYRVHYLITAATGPSETEGTAWSLAGVSMGDNDATNASKGTAVTVTDDTINAAQWDTMTTPWSGDVTVTNIAAGEVAEFNFERTTGDDVDDYGQLVGVYAVEIRYQRVPVRP